MNIDGNNITVTAEDIALLPAITQSALAAEAAKTNITPADYLIGRFTDLINEVTEAFKTAQVATLRPYGEKVMVMTPEQQAQVYALIDQLHDAE